MADTWSPDIYAKFRVERNRPVDDLLAMVRPAHGGRVADLGCGSGAVTVALHGLVGAGETVGIDSSAAMLADAPRADGVEFRRGDLATFADTDGFDLVFANASLQWVPDHPSLFERVWQLIRPGGKLAVHVPSNFDHPSHTLADQLGRSRGLEPLARAERVLAPSDYAELLWRLGAVDEDVRLVVYGARLERTDDVIEWVKGSLLTHYQRELGARYESFLDEYRTQLLVELGDPGGDQPYYYPFPRILMTATKPASVSGHRGADELLDRGPIVRE